MDQGANLKFRHFKWEILNYQVTGRLMSQNNIPRHDSNYITGSNDVTRTRKHRNCYDNLPNHTMG